MALSITTDGVKDCGDPEPFLRKIANAGFSHIHWCHHWETDFLYAESEITQISEWLDDFGLKVLDIHASHGREKSWVSAREYARLAGVELIKNRIAMAASLGGKVIILHVFSKSPTEDRGAVLAQVRKSLTELKSFALENGVRIALENILPHDFVEYKQLFSEFGSDYLGLCYDCGHGCLAGDGLDQLEIYKDRLISVHLHDNDGLKDYHRLPFTGKVDWPRLAKLIAQSSYAGCVSMESVMRHQEITDEDIFLQKAFEAGTRLSEMIAGYKAAE